MLAGVITEGEYRAVINKEIEEADKASLNESMIGGIVGIGAINQIPPRAKADYEMAFEHFLGERYEVKPNRERDDIKDVNEAEGNNEVEEFLNDLINTSIPEDSEEGEEVTGVWKSSEYADEDTYDDAQEFTNAHKHITDQGGEITIEGNPDVKYTALPNGDIQYSLIVTLDEISMNEEELDESVLAVAGGIILGILGLKTLARIMKGIFGAVSLIRMTDPKKLKEAVAEIGREAIMKRGKNPIQVALWMTTVNSMIDSGEVKNGVDLGKTWGNIDKIDLETALNSSESEEVEEPNNN